MRAYELHESRYITPTDEIIEKAKAFCLRKWVERHIERFPGLAADRPDMTPTDLSYSCKFTSLFAQKLFGGVLRGNYHHQYLISNGKKIDLNIDAADVKRLGKKAYRHDAKFFGNRHHQASLDSCMPRVNQWVEEFKSELNLTESWEATPKDFGFRSDNPGGDWLASKQRRAEADAVEYRHRGGMLEYMISGAVTAHMGIFKPMYISTKLLSNLDGANQEERYRKPGESKYDSLAQSVNQNGWDQKYAIMVRVNHKGRAFIVEGNTRMRIALANGIRDVLVQFEWMNGAEDCADDLWSPKRVASLCVTKPELDEKATAPNLREDYEYPFDRKRNSFEKDFERLTRGLGVRAVFVMLDPWISELELHRFVADQQGTGGGTKAMNVMTKLADHYNFDLSLTLLEESRDRLRTFYSRFGFKDSGDRRMRRPARNSKQRP
jgi:hypothetical protein